MFLYSCTITPQLFSSALRQAGKNDDDGFLGFLASDVKKEARRGKRLVNVMKCLLYFTIVSRIELFFYKLFLHLLTLANLLQLFVIAFNFNI